MRIDFFEFFFVDLWVGVGKFGAGGKEGWKGRGLYISLIIIYLFFFGWCMF